MTYSTIIQDNFFEDPEDIRKFALKQEYYPCDFGYWPGVRTKYLHEINKKFSEYVFKKLMATGRFVNLNNIDMVSHFQIIQPFSDDPTDLTNRGFIHVDKHVSYNTDNITFDLAGVIYLTPNAHRRAGTSIYEYVGKEPTPYIASDIKIPLYKDNVKVDEFYSKAKTHYSQFREAVAVSNVFNRLITFDSGMWHGCNNFHTGIADPRLTLVFFIRTHK